MKLFLRLLGSALLTMGGLTLVASPAQATFDPVIPVYPTVTQPTRVCDFEGETPKSVLIPGKIEWGNVEHGLWSFFSRGVNPNIGGNIPGLEPGVYTLHFEAVAPYQTPKLEDWLEYNPEPADIEVTKTWPEDPKDGPPYWTFTITMFEPAALDCARETVTATATATATQTAVSTALPVTSPPQPAGIAAVAMAVIGAGAGFILWGRRRRTDS